MNYQTEKRQGHATITLTNEVAATKRPSGKFVVYGAKRPHVPQRVRELRDDSATLTFDDRIKVRVTNRVGHSFS